MFKKTLRKLDEFYSINLRVLTLSSVDFHSKNNDIYDKNSREWKLDVFQKTNRKCVILSVKILDECIDVPKCDSIYITYPSESKIRTIQRMCRCMRKTNNPNKIIEIVFII